MTESSGTVWERRVAPFCNRFFWVLCAVLVVIACGRIISTYTALSLTVDEPNHFAAGLEWVAKHVYRYEPQHAPLSRAMQAIGPYIAGARPFGLPVMRDDTLAVLAHSGNVDRMIFLMRLGNLPFFLLGCATVCLWTRHVFGKPTAVLATGLFTLLPTILADASLATTDMAAAATVGAAFFASIYWVEDPNWRRALLMGVCVAIAVLSKFTVFGYLPLALFFALVFYLAMRRPELRQVRRLGGARVRTLLLATGVVLLVVWAGYWFTTGWVHSRLLPGGMSLWVPAPALLEGVRAVVDLNERGHPGFLLGELRTTGWWYYLPIALAVKTPIPFLLLVALGTAVCFQWRSQPLVLMPIALWLGVLLPAMKSHLAVGVRYVDAVYLAWSVIAALGLRWILEKPKSALVAVATAGALVIWMVASVAAVHPDYLTYFNALAGNHPENVLVDSNYDWGQDLRLLAKRLNELGVKEVTVYTLDGVKRPEYLEQWYHLPPVNKTVDPLVPTPGWTVIGVTFDKSILPWDRKLKGDMSIPWWDKMEPRERLGGLRLYYVPGSAGGGDPGISTKGNR